MFQNLKNKIITETGQDPSSIAFRSVSNSRLNRHSLSSQNSLSIDELSKIEEVCCFLRFLAEILLTNVLQKDAEINSLRTELVHAKDAILTLEHEKRSLADTLKVGQVQKEMFYDETDKIQNVQQQEINKLKSMLVFREQVSL